MLHSELAVGDKVAEMPTGFGSNFSQGTIISVDNPGTYAVTYRILWDGFEWETEGWHPEELCLPDGISLEQPARKIGF